MSKIGNHRVGLQETDDYFLGWGCAENGSPRHALTSEAWKLGWDDFHQQERQP